MVKTLGVLKAENRSDWRSVTAKRVCACCAGVLLGLVAVQGHAQPASPPQAPIRLAMIEGLSGPFANTGEAAF